jgi:hypothetical protein
MRTFHIFSQPATVHLAERCGYHASLRTTATYGDVVGSHERAFAARMRSDFETTPLPQKRTFSDIKFNL